MRVRPSAVHHAKSNRVFFENMVLSCFQRLRPDGSFASNVTTGRQKETDCFGVHGVCNHCNTFFGAMSCHHHYCPCQEAQTSLIDADS